MRARLVFWSGASGMGANAVDMKSTFVGVFKMNARPLSAAVQSLSNASGTGTLASSP